MRSVGTAYLGPEALRAGQSVCRCCCGNDDPEHRHWDGGSSRDSGGVEEVREVWFWRCDVTAVAPAPPQIRAEVLRDTLHPALESGFPHQHLGAVHLTQTHHLQSYATVSHLNHGDQ